LVFTVVDLRAVDVVGVDLRHRHGRVDGRVVAGVVAEVDEGPTQEQHDGYRNESADDVLSVHSLYSAHGIASATSFRSAQVEFVQATARSTTEGSRRVLG
jgi:hypothetical protein